MHVASLSKPITAMVMTKALAEIGIAPQAAIIDYLPTLLYVTVTNCSVAQALLIRWTECVRCSHARAAVVADHDVVADSGVNGQVHAYLRDSAVERMPGAAWVCTPQERVE
jgi:CubicO group peptidase (beta-lactamase class C family)